MTTRTRTAPQLQVGQFIVLVVGVDVVNIILPFVRLGVQPRRALECPRQDVVHQQALETGAIRLVGIDVVAPHRESNTKLVGAGAKR